MHEKLIAIVPAAGIGARAQGKGAGADLPKQYCLLQGKPMLRWAVQALLADTRITQVRVAVAPGDTWAERALDGLDRTIWRPCGGPTRAATVAAALRDAALATDDWVMVHDAARPGLPPEALARLIDQCLHTEAGGLLALPVSDTVKRSTGNGVVAGSVARAELWLAQTPQMFHAAALLQALESADAAGTEITDEASAMELAGHAPQLVPGSARNFKVTWPEDFDLMGRWLRA